MEYPFREWALFYLNIGLQSASEGGNGSFRAPVYAPIA